MHDERVHVVLDQAVGLLRDDRGQDDVAGVSDGRHQAETSSVASAVRASGSSPVFVFALM